MSRHFGSVGLLASWESLGRDGLIYLVGEGGGKGLTYLLLILVAGLGSVEDFGAINLFIAISGLVAVVVGLGLPDGLLRFFFRELAFGEVLGASVTLVIGCTVVAGLALAALTDPLAQVIPLERSLLFLIIVCAGAVALRSCWLAVLRAQGRSVGFAVARWVEPLLMACGIGVVVYLHGGTGHRPIQWIYTGAILIVALYGLADLGRSSGMRLSPRPVRELVLYSAPLVPHALAMTGLASFDQIVIGQLLGLERTGLYALAYRFGMAMFLVAFGLASAWNPLVYRELGKTEGGADLGLLGRSAFRWAAAAAALLCFALPGLAIWVGGPAYRNSAGLIPIVVYGYLWMTLYSLAVPFLTFENRTGALAKSSAAAFLVNAVLNYLLIPRFGVAAAAITTVVSYALLFLLVWRRLERGRVGVPFGRLLGEVVAFAPICLLAWRVFSR